MPNVLCALERLSMELNTTILTMGSLVEEMLVGAVDALGRQDVGSARALLTRHRLVGRHVHQVDELALALLLHDGRQEAILRLATATMAIARDLDHMASLAVDVAECALHATSRPPSRPMLDLHRLEEIARRMLRDALQAFARRSAPLARAISHDENEEDGVCQSLGRDLETLMMDEPAQVSGSMTLLLASRSLQRVCDHATCIAESIVFIAEGAPVPVIPHGETTAPR